MVVGWRSKTTLHLFSFSYYIFFGSIHIMHESFYFLLLSIQKRGGKLNFLPLYSFIYQITKKNQLLFISPFRNHWIGRDPFSNPLSEHMKWHRQGGKSIKVSRPLNGQLTSSFTSFFPTLRFGVYRESRRITELYIKNKNDDINHFHALANKVCQTQEIVTVTWSNLIRK